MFSIRFAFLASISIISLLSGCLSQDFERQSLAKYRTNNASTFVGFDPVGAEDLIPKPVSSQRVANGSGRFTGPGGGRFTSPGGRFTFPAGNRFTSPGGAIGRGGQFSFPRGRFSSPGGNSNFRNNARFTWPRQNARNGFTQPSSGLTWPRKNSGRFTRPRK